MKNILLTAIIFIGSFSIGYSQCIKANVSIAGPSSISICEGETLMLSGSATASGTSQNGGFTYSWKTSTTVIIPPTDITLPANIPTAISDFTINSAVIATGGTYILRVEDGSTGNAVCYTEASIVVTVYPKVTTPVITADQTICAGDEAVPIGGPPATGGSNTDEASYVWESSRIGGSGWVTIAGASSKDYAPGILIAQDYFRRTDIKGSCRSATSNVVKITVPTPVQISSDGGNVCQGSPVLFTAATTNGDPTPLYEWFINNVSQGAPTSSPEFSTILASSTDRIHVKLANSTTTCKTSAPTYITVAAGITGGTIGSDQTVCYNSNPYILQTAAPTNIIGTPTYTWEISAVRAGAFTTIFGATNATLTSSPQITSDVYIRRITTDPSIASPCNVATSNVVHITVLPQLVAGVIGSDETICSGTVPTTIAQTSAPAGGTGTYTYQWQSDISGTGVFTNMVGFWNSTFGPGVLTKTTSFRRVETSGVCGSITSNVVVKEVLANCTAFSTTISGPNPITPGQQNVVYSVPDQTGFTYTWSITGGTIISGQNTHSVTVDWDAATNAFARTTSAVYSISVLEKNSTNQTKTTTTNINTITTAVTQSQAQSGINVFPNPTTGSFNIEMPESGITVSYKIVDLTGLAIASGTFTSTGSDQKIDADFGAGMYQVILTYNNNITTVRLSKVQ